jgi:hypothetical protein
VCVGGGGGGGVGRGGRHKGVRSGDDGREKLERE